MKSFGILVLLCLCKLHLYANWSLVFNDEFDIFDTRFWSVEENYRNSAQNTKEAVFVRDGKLIIKAFTKNDKYFTGIVTSKNKVEFNNGYIEISAKLNPIKGAWSAGWLYHDDVALNEQNYRNNGLEIDIWENRLFDSNKKNIGNYINQGFHYNGYENFHKCLGADTGDIGLNDEKFHTFSLIWDKKGFMFFVDGRMTYKCVTLNTKKNLFMIFSVEVGEVNGWTLPPDKDIDTEILSIDYIRYYRSFRKE